MSDNCSVKGILKKDSPRESGSIPTSVVPTSHPLKHLKWDEVNLAETEANKSATMKITEPKTPFIHGTGVYSDDEQYSNPTNIPGLHLGSDSEGSSVHFSSSAEWESSEELDSTLTPEERTKRKERFRQMRKDHYRMKDALKKGRALVQSESDQDDDNDDKDDAGDVGKNVDYNINHDSPVIRRSELNLSNNHHKKVVEEDQSLIDGDQ